MPEIDQEDNTASSRVQVPCLVLEGVVENEGLPFAPRPSLVADSDAARLNRGVWGYSQRKMASHSEIAGTE
eukprot:CAMPEP_0202120548 /NCGR_PEP_ID=MMETSP0965-20130614/44204_1 /ASSEMBLY_ACC=CAM_ASM_000507 /TAXON_ID=4773 /ORGANISM="Schizochytrium aggregatum, Strain ATCC28209" /LENGTH=70 /DNA_ID=CAMNT_0048690471 /DNA_START=854 /DNA_END=1063 /DNA_ORIENTATION=-